MSDVVPSAHAPVLAVLAATTTPLTGRKIAELTQPRVSQARVASILRELAASGLVDRTPAGPALLFALNRQHLAAPAVELLASLRTQLWDRMIDDVQGWIQTPDAVVVFGSTARGDGGSTSDIDVLVVRPATVDEDDPEWHRDLTRFAARVTRWTGNACELLDRSPQELAAMARNGERLLGEIRRDGRAVVGSLAAVPTPRAA
ncbi:MAG: hypothetical protein B7X41_07550 [Microbacterium sp. 14-71-5]|jgi:predicted nucleotidyltransferase|nr:MAG: hypothetical protein B7X41_07550 [Microbacterium sp. 14-71-5]